jgi:ribosomal protein S18 acetylase RimI-like enzyme
VTLEYHCEALAAHHQRATFGCGVAELDRYFHQQVTQDIRRRVTSCFVAATISSGAIAGYYTLASAGIPIGEVPTELLRRLPRYPTLPAVRIGRLAVDGAYRGRGIGELLLFDAAARAYRADQANYALLVDAKDEHASAFYRRYGFVPYASNPLILFLPLSTAVRLIEQTEPRA